jgi:hypothetical protein
LSGKKVRNMDLEIWNKEYFKKEKKSCNEVFKEELKK